MNNSFEILRRVNAALLDDQPDLDDHKKIIKFLYEEHSNLDAHRNSDSRVDHFRQYVVGGIQLSAQTFLCENT